MTDLGEFPNGIVDEGLHDMLNRQFREGPASGPWSIGLIDNAGFTAVAAGGPMRSHAGWAESTAYTEANRLAWGPDAAATRSITNGTALDFSINATATIYGLFATNDNTKGGTTGVLWATAAFPSPISVTSGGTLRVTYSISG